MSAINPPIVNPAENPDLDARYLRLLQNYDNRAIRSKRWMMWLLHASMLLTWVPLLLAIVALGSGLREGDPYYSLVVVILRVASLANLAVILAQMLSAFRSNWLRYRAATERLRENCMLFRARLNKFGGDDAAQTFRTALDELEEEVGERRPFHLLDHIPWPYLIGLQPLPEKLRGPLEHAPDKGLYPCCDELATAWDIVIRDRLRNQQRWHLLKARRYSRGYLLLQVVIALLWLISAFWRLQHGYDFAWLALLSTMTMCLSAYRERLSFDQLCVRYTRIVETLERIERDYETQTKEEGANTAQRLERLRQTAALIERSLSSEFQYWYFGRENFGSARTS